VALFPKPVLSTQELIMAPVIGATPVFRGSFQSNHNRKLLIFTEPADVVEPLEFVAVIPTTYVVFEDRLLKDADFDTTPSSLEGMALAPLNEYV
jgi:hypothetical protein